MMDEEFCVSDNENIQKKEEEKVEKEEKNSI